MQFRLTLSPLLHVIDLRQTSSVSLSMDKPGEVGKVSVLKGKPRMEEALQLLKKVHALCKPIQRK